MKMLLHFSIIVFFGNICCSEPDDKVVAITKKFQKKVEKSLSEKLSQDELRNLLLEAIGYPNLGQPIFEELIERGAYSQNEPKDKKDVHVPTLLYRAVLAKNKTAVHVMLRHTSSEINTVVGHYKKTPLQVACDVGDPEIICLLLKYGADSYVLDTKRKAPVDYPIYRVVTAEIFQSQNL